MSDEGERTCPLCAEEMDLTDQQLKPCKCGYEICVWCWHHIIDMAEKDETEGRCPACRSSYDKERIVGTAANCERLVSEINAERKQKPHKAKPKTSAEMRKQLNSVRVIQRNLVYIIGLPSNLADESMLESREYFGQYGKVLKVSISRSAGGAQQTSSNNTFNLYITYAKEEEAVRCIQAVHNFVLEGKTLRACFGTTKYCHTWLRNMTCSNPDCLYLHDVGCQEDSFTKDEVISAYTRSRVPQIASNNLQRRLGNVLPAPADDFCISGAASTSKLVVKGSSNAKSCSPDGGTVGSVSGRSTVLPAAASWGLRANCRLPVSSTASLQGSTKQNPEPLSNSSVLSPVVATTKHTSAWHDVAVSTQKIAEESGVMHLEGRCRSLESSKSIGRDAQTAATNVSAGVAQMKSTSAWDDDDDDDDDITTSRISEESHATYLDDRFRLLESSKSFGRDSRAAVLNTKETSTWSDDEITPEISDESHEVQLGSRTGPFDPSKPFIVQDSKINISNFTTEIIYTKQTSAWDDDLIVTPKMSEENNSVPFNGRSRSSEASKSCISRDSRTFISDLKPEIVLDTSHISTSTSSSSSLAALEYKDKKIVLSEVNISVTSISCSPSPAAPKDKDRDVIPPEKNPVPANKMQPEDLYHGPAPDKVTSNSTAINGNIQDLFSGLSLRNPDNHREVRSPNVDGKQNSLSHLGSVGLHKNLVPELQQFPSGHGIEHFTSVHSSKAALSSEEEYISRELSDWTSEPQKQILPPTVNETGCALSSAKDHRLKHSDIATQSSYLAYSSQSLHNPVLGNHLWNSDLGSTYTSVNGDCRIPGVEISETPLMVRGDNILSNDEIRIRSLANLGKILERPNINSSGEDMKHLGQLNDLSGIDKAVSVDVGENNIISNILSMDFDPWDDSLISANNFAKFFSESDRQSGSLRMSTSWKAQNNNQSRFSFARQESQATCSEPSFSEARHAKRMDSFLHNSLGDGLQNGFTARGFEDPKALINSSHSVISSDRTAGVSRAKTSAPPGFSVPNRAPPPGFASQDRLDQAYDATFSENLLLGSSSLRNQYQTPLPGNTGDVEFNDPAILAVGEGRLPPGLNNSNFGLRSAFSTQLNTSIGDPRLHLLMQRSLSATQGMRNSDHIGDRFLPPDDSYIASRFVAQNHNSPLPFAQMSLQPSRNLHVSGNQWNGWNDVQFGGDIDLTEILRNERLGLNNYFPGNENLEFHLPSSGNLYNRAFGM